MRWVWRNKITTVALLFLFAVIVGAILANYLPIASATNLDIPGRNEAPFSQHNGFHIFGTDPLGRDMFGQLMLRRSGFAHRQRRQRACLGDDRHRPRPGCWLPRGPGRPSHHAVSGPADEHSVPADRPTRPVHPWPKHDERCAGVVDHPMDGLRPGHSRFDALAQEGALRRGGALARRERRPHHLPPHVAPTWLGHSPYSRRSSWQSCS